MSNTIDLKKQYQDDARAWMEGKSDAELANVFREQKATIKALEAVHKEELLAHAVWVDMLDGEMLRRMAEGVVDSMSFEGIGRVTRVLNKSYTVVDPDALLELVKETGNISIFNAKLKVSDVQQLIEQLGTGDLPKGIGMTSAYSLRFTPAKD